MPAPSPSSTCSGLRFAWPEWARAALDRLGLDQVPLDRRIGELSGGERVLLCLAAEFLWRPGVLLLDESTNNLDLAARRRLYEAVRSWRGAMVIVSHDRELLDLVDQICELRSGQVRWYGGNLSDYERAAAVEQEAAERAVRPADADVRRQQRELAEARIKLDRRQRYGRKMQETGGLPKIVAGNLKRQAEVSAGKLRTGHEDRLDEARERLAAAEDAVRGDDEIRIDLPAPQLPMLDEPTNNLDMASVRQLSGALRSYRGALLVASHDVPFLREVGITRWLRLDGNLAEIGPL